MKQAGQKSVKEELAEQWKGSKRAVECRLKVPTHIWDQETVRSSRTTRTKIPLKSLISEGFIYSLSIAAQEVIENTLFFLFDLLCSDKCALTSRHTSDILHIE